MKLAAATFLLGLVSASGFNFDDAKGTPIDKVIVLITGLAKDIEKDGADEQASYDKYSCWVEDTMQRKATDISKAKELIGELNDSVKKLKAEIASHGAEIKQLQKDIAQNNEATKDATALRKKENSEYASDRAESEQCTGALEAAVKVLTGAGTKKSGFLQEAQLMSVAGGVRKVVSHAAARAKMSDTDLQLINRFVQDPQAFTARGLVAAQTGQNPFGDYAPQSTQIQGILKGMYDAFTSDIEKDNADEANKQKSFEELMAVKTQELKTLEASLQTQETDSAAKTKQLSEDSVLRDDTIEQLAADEKFFEETKTAAEAKATEWSQRVRLRTEELAGMEGAVQILKGGDKTFKEATTTFVQLKSVRLHSASNVDAYGKLKSLAAKYRSASLTQVVNAMREGGHFDKIFVMIDHMMALLREEEQEDIEHRDRCENGQNANANDIDDAKAAIDKTKKKLGRMANTEDGLKKELGETELAIKNTKKDMKELLDMRNKEHAEFVRALQVDAESIALIGQATARLTKYYKANNIPLEFVQAPEYSKDPDKAPETSFSGADSHQGESTGIVAILSMIKEDLQKEMAEGKADEAKAQADYEKQNGALQGTLDAQTETKVSLEKELSALEEKMSGAEKYKKEREGDLTSEGEMKKALGTDCAWVKDNFDKRRKARKSEMDGLVEAKSFLAGVESGEPVIAM